MTAEVPLPQRIRVRHVQGDEYAVLLRAHEGSPPIPLTLPQVEPER